MNKKPRTWRLSSGKSYPIGRIFSAGLIALLLAGFMIAGLACNTGPRPTSLTIPLELKSKEAYFPIASGQQAKVFVFPVEDKRPDTTKIGENHEKPLVVPIMAGDKTPAQWVQEVMITQLKNSGIDVATSPDDADRRIYPALTQFWAIEGGGYEAQIALNVSVQDKSGRVISTFSASGVGHNGGHSLSVENYQITFSRAMEDMWKRSLQPGFAQALTVAPVTGTPVPPTDVTPMPPPAR